MNSAARFHAIVSAAAEIPSGTARQAWAKALGVSDDPPSVLRAVGQLMELAQQVERDVQALSGHDTELHLKPLRELTGSFRPFHLEEAWKQARQRIDASAVRALAYTADALRLAKGTSVIDAATLKSLRQRLDETTAAILESDIDHALKSDLVRYLELARRALIEYRIRGPEGLREALDINLGLLARSRGTVTSEREVSALKRIWLFLGELDTALSLAGYGLQLAPAAAEVVILGYSRDGRTA